MLSSNKRRDLTQIDWTIPKVVLSGIDAGLFGPEAHGWFTIASKEGYPFRQGSTDEPTNKSVHYRASIEDQIAWLHGRDLLTSFDCTMSHIGNAVIATCYDFYIGYASELTDRRWNEAIVVVSAILVYQFNAVVTTDARWHLKENPCIQLLRDKAHWTK